MARDTGFIKKIKNWIKDDKVNKKFAESQVKFWQGRIAWHEAQIKMEEKWLKDATAKTKKGAKNATI